MPDANQVPYPLPGFSFQVTLAGLQGDTSFQEVDGIPPEIEVDPATERGENRFVHRLPKPPKHTILELKRGLATLDSPLVKWCRSVLEADLSRPIQPREISVALLDAAGAPVRVWTFTGTYPVKWTIDAFHAHNEVAIETLELAFSSLTRSQ